MLLFDCMPSPDTQCVVGASWLHIKSDRIKSRHVWEWVWSEYQVDIIIPDQHTHCVLNVVHPQSHSTHCLSDWWAIIGSICLISSAVGTMPVNVWFCASYRTCLLTVPTWCHAQSRHSFANCFLDIDSVIVALATLCVWTDVCVSVANHYVEHTHI